jgi:hypothetical protein
MKDGNSKTRRRSVMKSKFIKSALTLACAAGLTVLAVDAQAYYYYRSNYYHNGYYHHTYRDGYIYYRTGAVRCNWVGGHWYGGNWYAGHRVCWR